jgi:hypothetical protein
MCIVGIDIAALWMASKTQSEFAPWLAAISNASVGQAGC